MVDDGLSEEARRRKVFMVDRFGLLTDQMPNLLDFQQRLVTPGHYRPLGCQAANLSLMDVVRNVHPTVLIGVSRTAGSVQRRDYQRDASPLPASNRCRSLTQLPGAEAPAEVDLLEWTRVTR